MVMRKLVLLVVIHVMVASSAAAHGPTKRDCLDVPGLPGVARVLAPGGVLVGGLLGTATAVTAPVLPPVAFGLTVLVGSATFGILGEKLGEVADDTAKVMQRRNLGCYLPGGPFGLVENPLGGGMVVGIPGVGAPAGLLGSPEGLLGVGAPAGLLGPPASLLGVGGPAGLFNETLRRSTG